MKTKIIEKSADMFLSMGFKSVTMDDIASEMGISKKTIYQHFANKTKLVEACTYHLYEVICTGINDICSAADNPIEELYNIKRAVMMHLKNEQTSPQFQLKKYYPKLFEDLMWKQFQIVRDHLAENLRTGIEMGIYRENLDIEFVSRMYFKGMNGIKDEDIFPRESFSMHYLMESYLEYHLRAITTKKGLEILNRIINEHKTAVK